MKRPKIYMRKHLHLCTFAEHTNRAGEYAGERRELECPDGTLSDDYVEWNGTPRKLWGMALFDADFGVRNTGHAGREILRELASRFPTEFTLPENLGCDSQ